MSKTFVRLLSGAVIISAAMGFFIVPAYASKTTDDFIKKATIGNQFEISSSRLALQKSQNDNVKSFAQQMIDDHTQAASDMKAAIASDSSSPTQPTPSLDREHQKMEDKLNKLSGSDFDKQYVKMQVSAHKDTVSLFEKYIKKGDDQQLKDFATKTLPTLKEHKQHIDQINSSM